MSATKELMAAHIAAREAIFAGGLECGPVYGGDNGVWHDQFFEREITPGGSVECGQALRVGATQNGLDVILRASHANTETLKIAAGATITLKTMTASEELGEYEETGPGICVKAPAGGLEAEPCRLVCRFAVGNFEKPWLKVLLEFDGAFSGGAVDCALAYMPR